MDFLISYSFEIELKNRTFTNVFKHNPKLLNFECLFKLNQSLNFLYLLSAFFKSTSKHQIILKIKFKSRLFYQFFSIFF